VRALAIVHQEDAGPGVFADAIRSRGVELDSWLRAEADSPPRDPRAYDSVLVFGGAMHADQEDRHPWLREEKTLLGELIAEAAGAPARPARRPEIGWHGVEVTAEGRDDPLLGPLAPRFEAFQWHSYEFPLPPGAMPLARSATCLQAYRVGASTWGIQFHAEVSGEDAEAWIDDYRSDEDAVRIGLDPDELRRNTRVAIADWNALGRGLCERFLLAASTGRA
jgi:GMP synthase (glutamine-hydrolysing)